MYATFIHSRAPLSSGLQFYEGLAKQAATNGHTVDLFACAFDQTGLHEMRYLPNYTGYVAVARRIASQLTYAGATL